jgi:hypothetical protein
LKPVEIVLLTLQICSWNLVLLKLEHICESSQPSWILLVWNNSTLWPLHLLHQSVDNPSIGLYLIGHYLVKLLAWHYAAEIFTAIWIYKIVSIYGKWTRWTFAFIRNFERLRAFAYWKDFGHLKHYIAIWWISTYEHY